MHKLAALLLVVGATACTDEPLASTTRQAITDATNTFDANGLDTGITWGLHKPYSETDPPDPDLQLLFSPIKGLIRTSEYVDVSGGRTIDVTATPPEPDTDPPNPDTDPPQPDFQMSVLGRDGQVATTVTVQPPEPDAQPPDPDAQPPEPDHVTLRMQLAKSATVEVYDVDGRLLGTLGAT